MTTYTPPEIDFSTFLESDGEPVAENTENPVQMIDLIFALQGLLRAQGRTRWMVGGNQFLYYNERNGRDHVAPDVYVGFDLARRRRPSWKTWIEGKSPDIVTREQEARLAAEARAAQAEAALQEALAALARQQDSTHDTA